MKGDIYEFNPAIYKTRLWVCRKDTTIDDIDGKFYAMCDDGSAISFKENHKLPDYGTAAETFIVGHKDLRITGCLVYLNREVGTGVIAHEAAHIADWLFEQIGETQRSYEHGEPYAYYVEWIADSISKVWRGKA